jgi:two-component system chemotaxis response regulator CheY
LIKKGILKMGNILIVDDSSLIRSVASKAVKAVGHNPIIATNGEEGIQACQENKIDLIFSDVNMPVMNGMEMVSKIKENEEFRYIPVVMLTTESGDEIKSEGKALGVKAWMVKPFNENKFGIAVKKLLG